MCRYLIDVVLQEVDICKYGVVDALQYIVGCIWLNGIHFVSVVNESVAQGLNVRNGAFNVKVADDLVEIVHFYSLFLK